MVCFHDDTHMIFTHSDSARNADRALASNAKIDMRYGVPTGDDGVHVQYSERL